jgi:cobalamin biosynthesis Mg chelatase CobN
MSAIRQNLHNFAIYGTVSMLLILSACYSPSTATPFVVERVLVTPAKTDTCEACDQATLMAAKVQEQNKFDIQAAATAEILLANAQATLNSANATLKAVQTQEQNNANVIAAQVAATAEIVRANAKATLVAAGSTQSAALTQDSIQQTQEQYSLQVAAGMATQNSITIAKQQQLEKQRQAPITFLWMWCLPIFLLLLAGLVLWGVWRWLKMQQSDSLPYLNRRIVNRPSQFTKPKDDQALRWLDEVKRNLLRSNTKDKDDYPDD